MIDGGRKRFAAHVLYYDAHKWILRMIENCAPFVERIYVGYSELPWATNPGARSDYKNTSKLGVLSDSRHFDKVCVVEGVWESESDERNACLYRARSDGFDYMILQDADEFYPADVYRNMLREICAHPDHDFYRATYCSFWKDFSHVLAAGGGDRAVASIAVAVNCKRKVAFSRNRRLDTGDSMPLDAMFYHGSYVLTDDEVWRKIRTWGHAGEFNAERWYRRKWLKWNPSTRNLHPTVPTMWKRAVPFCGVLPQEIRDMQAADLQPASLTHRERIAECLLELGEDIGGFISHGMQSARRMLGKMARGRVKELYRSFKDRLSHLRPR